MRLFDSRHSLFWKPLTVLAAVMMLTTLGRTAEARPTSSLDIPVPDGLTSGKLSPTGAIPGLLGASAPHDTTWFGGTVWAADSLRWEAIQDSCWTFDTGVGSHFNHALPGVDPGKDPSLHAGMEGWIGIDVTNPGGLGVFRVAGPGDFDPGETVCVGSAAGLEGSRSLWAGLSRSEAAELCYAAGSGYGDSWNVWAEKSFAVPAGSGSATLEYDYAIEVEGGFDYVTAYADTGGGAPIELQVYTGTVAGHATLNLDRGVELPVGAGSLRILFSVVSDAVYSDEDGSYPTTCGAAAIDAIVLSGAVVSGPDTFEAGTDGWMQSASPPFEVPNLGGDWSHLAALGDLPTPLAPCACAMSDSVLIFEDFLAGGHNDYQDNLAASPWIDLLAAGLAGAPGKVLAFDVYADLRLKNYIFVQTQMQWYPDTCPTSGRLRTSPFTSDGFVRYFDGVPTCTNVAMGKTLYDFTSVVPSGAEQMRVAVGVLSYCQFFAGCTGITNSTPWFDNIQLGVSGSPLAPYIAATPIDLPQDSFPANGGIETWATARVDANYFRYSTGAAPYSSLGDTLVVRGGSVASGSGAEVRVQFAVDPGPGIAAPALNSWLTPHQGEGTWLADRHSSPWTWYSARMDTAQVGGTLFPGRWMTAYHEADPNFTGTDNDLDASDLSPWGGLTRLANDIFPDNLFTPGTRLALFYKARYEGSSEWYVHPDTAGGNYLEMEVLPSSMSPAGEWNCALYVDHADEDIGVQSAVEAGMAAVIPGGSANAENVPWDRYDVRASGMDMGSLARPTGSQFGAAFQQIFDYSVVLWHTGSNPEFNLTDEDGALLQQWLDGDFKCSGGFFDLPPCEWYPRRLHLSGDDLASSIDGAAATDPLALTLMEDYLGVVSSCNTLRDADCPGGSLADSSACIELSPVGGAHFVGSGTPTAARGNGCPDLASFDVLGLNGSLPVAVGNERYLSTVKGPVNFASVSVIETDVHNSNLTVFDGVSIHHRRDAATCSDTYPTIDRITQVMAWFGATNGQSWCGPFSPTDGTPDPGPVFATRLLPFAPNPLTGANGQVRFSLAAEQRVEVALFDIAGRRVRSLVDAVREAGNHELAWDGADDGGRRVAGGVYFLRLKTGENTLSRKLVVAR